MPMKKNEGKRKNIEKYREKRATKVNPDMMRLTRVFIFLPLATWDSSKIAHLSLKIRFE